MFFPRFILDDDPMLIGKFIKGLREAIGITQKDISDGTGFSIQTISKLENGKVNPNSISATEILAYIMKTTGTDEESVIQSYRLFKMENVSGNDDILLQ